MMIYTYQDGVPLPVQRDLIQDIRNYIECLEQVLPLENAIIEMKDLEKEKIQSLDRQLTDLNNFRSQLIEFFQQKQYADTSGALGPSIDGMTKILNEAVRKSRETLDSDSGQIKRESRNFIERTNAKIFECLSPFLISSVYGAARQYHIEYKGQSTTGMLTEYISGLEYKYTLAFSDERISARKMLGRFNLPRMVSAGIFSKDEKPKVEDLSDYYIQEVHYAGQEDFLLILENRNSVFKIVCKGGFFSVYENEREITADATLLPLVDEKELSSIPEKIMNYIRSNTSSFKLKEIFVDEVDALEDNLIFDSMKIIAEQYGPIIQECLKRNAVKSEIAIKIQLDDGVRSEKYISKDEVYSLLANIGGEGLEIVGIMGVDKTATRINNDYLIV